MNISSENEDPKRALTVYQPVSVHKIGRYKGVFIKIGDRDHFRSTEKESFTDIKYQPEKTETKSR